MLTRHFAAMGLMMLVAVRQLPGSEEEFLVWNEVRIVSPEREDTGKVVFAAKSDNGRFDTITIEAFGKTHVVGRDDLDKLSHFPLGSLRTMHEAGYERLGGHTIHFKMSYVKYDEQKRLFEHRVTLSVSKGRGIAITGPTSVAVDPITK
jgi:hypothetical protein